MHCWKSSCHRLVFSLHALFHWRSQECRAVLNFPRIRRSPFSREGVTGHINIARLYENETGVEAPLAVARELYQGTALTFRNSIRLLLSVFDFRFDMTVKLGNTVLLKGENKLAKLAKFGFANLAILSEWDSQSFAKSTCLRRCERVGKSQDRNLSNFEDIHINEIHEGI